MPGPRLQDPLVLVHGILGFDRLPTLFGPIEYFREVRQTLHATGTLVPAPPQLNPAGSVPDRAQELKHYLETHPEVAGRRVHLVAHSLGGLDARHMLAHLHMAHRVLTLTTIGTPHHGTPVANRGFPALQPLIDLLLTHDVDIRGFMDLTTTAAAQFNAATPDAAGVQYFSVAGEYTPGPLDLLKLSHDIIREEGGGPNDGLVPIASAQHGRFVGVWQANHVRLVNWATNLLIPPRELLQRDILEHYLQLVQLLRGQGF